LSSLEPPSSVFGVASKGEAFAWFAWFAVQDHGKKL